MNHRYIENKAYEILIQLDINSVNELDLNRVLKHFNIDKEKVELDDDISGLFLSKDGQPYIRVNKNHDHKRQRFTIAHELGHFILHKDVSLFVDKSTRVFYRDLKSSTGEVLKEREANHFAASLLMPEHFIKDEIDKIDNLQGELSDYLAPIFRVSSQAMSFRLANLGYDFGIF